MLRRVIFVSYRAELANRFAENIFRELPHENHAGQPDEEFYKDRLEAKKRRPHDHEGDDLKSV